MIEQKIPIYAKAKFDAAQIEAKVEKKCDGIELHLLKEMYPNNINDLSKIDLFKTMKKSSCCPPWPPTGFRHTCS